MKVTIIEHQNGIWIDMDLTPETLEEAAILLRLARRRKKVLPMVKTSYCDTIKTYIHFEINTSSNAPDTGVM